MRGYTKTLNSTYVCAAIILSAAVAGLVGAFLGILFQAWVPFWLTAIPTFLASMDVCLRGRNE